VSEKEVAELGHSLKLQVSNPGAAIDENILVDQKGRSTQAKPNTRAATENLYAHR
jgi:hypothetical protein